MADSPNDEQLYIMFEQYVSKWIDGANDSVQEELLGSESNQKNALNDLIQGNVLDDRRKIWIKKKEDWWMRRNSLAQRKAESIVGPREEKKVKKRGLKRLKAELQRDEFLTEKGRGAAEEKVRSLEGVTSSSFYKRIQQAGTQEQVEKVIRDAERSVLPDKSKSLIVSSAEFKIETLKQAEAETNV